MQALCHAPNPPFWEDPKLHAVGLRVPVLPERHHRNPPVRGQMLVQN